MENFAHVAQNLRNFAHVFDFKNFDPFAFYSVFKVLTFWHFWHSDIKITVSRNWTQRYFGRIFKIEISFETVFSFSVIYWYIYIQINVFILRCQNMLAIRLIKNTRMYFLLAFLCFDYCVSRLFSFWHRVLCRVWARSRKYPMQDLKIHQKELTLYHSCFFEPNDQTNFQEINQHNRN